MSEAGNGEGIERRPISGRGLWISVAGAQWLSRAGVSPNAISIMSMVTGFAAGGLLWWSGRLDGEGMMMRLMMTGAAGCILLRLICNMLDGMVAIEGKRASRVGELYNEVPDRVSDAAVLIGGGYAMGGWVMMGYLATVGALMTAYVRAEAKVAGAEQDYCGPMAKPHRMWWMIAVLLYCAVRPGGWGYRTGDGVGEIGVILAVVFAGSCATVVRRLWRAGRALRRAEG